MTTQPRGKLRTLSTTAIGGLLFLLPIFVACIFLGYVYRIAAEAYVPLKPWLPFNTATGVMLVFAIAVLGLLVMCFFAGLMAKWAIGRHFSQRVERQLIKIYPRYAIYKDQIAGTFGGHENVPALAPVIVTRDGFQYVALEADRLANGLVLVYFPSAPDAWSGTVALVPSAQVRPLALSLHETLEVCERLGRDCASVLEGKV